MRALILCLCAACAIGPRLAGAHVIEEPVQLGFNGLASPFGRDSGDQYTDVTASGRYAYLGSTGSGVAVLDLDVGAYASGGLRNPELAAVYAPAGHADYQDVKTDGAVGYFSGGGGTDLVDLSDPLQPTRLSQITAASGGHANAKNAAVGGGYLYQVSETSPTIHVFDVANPLAPGYVRSISTPDAVGLHDATLVGGALYAAGAGGGVYVYDVHDVGSSAPTLDYSVSVGSPVGAAWPSADGQTLLTTEHAIGGELAAWDVSSTPTVVDSQSAGDLGFNAYSTAEVAVLGSMAFVAWRQAGVQVIDLDQLATDGLQRAGSYVVPGGVVSSGFTDVHSVYPFLHPTQVLFSHTSNGMYRVDASMLFAAASGDYDGDQFVGLLDYAVWRNLYGTDGAAADGNLDGVVDAADYTVWRDAYAAASGAALPAPEPATLLLTAAAAAWLPRTRRPSPHH